MKKVVLISCGSQKATKAVQAKDMYTSTLFKKSYAYAVQLHPDKIYILSAKYGLLDPNKTIAPYDMTLNKMNSAEILAEKVFREGKPPHSYPEGGEGVQSRAL